MPTTAEITNHDSLIRTIADVFEDHRRSGGGGDPREAARKVIAAIVGNDDSPGPLDRYEIRVVDNPAGKPVVVWYCPLKHEGGGDGHVGMIIRNLGMDQAGLTVGEILAAVAAHDTEEHNN